MIKRYSVLILLLPTLALAQYPGKPNCEAIKDQSQSYECMLKNADCSTPGWLNGAQRAECAAEERAMQRGLAEHRQNGLMLVLNQQEKAKLKIAEAAFEKFVRAQCEFESLPVAGGSGYANDFNACADFLREQRLRDYLRVQKNFELIRGR